jgi:hypothetical protein
MDMPDNRTEADVSAVFFSLAGVVVGALLTLVRDIWADRRTRSRSARYLAIRVVCLLDKYVEHCAEVATDDGLCQGQRDPEGCLRAQVSPPDSPEFPQDVDWKSINPELMYRLLSLPNEADAAARRVNAMWEFADPPDFDEFFEERQDQYGKLGLAAFALTQEIRKKYRIPPQDFGEWNPVEHLTKARAQVEEDRRKRRERIMASPMFLNSPAM